MRDAGCGMRDAGACSLVISVKFSVVQKFSTSCGKSTETFPKSPKIPVEIFCGSHELPW